MLIKYFYLLNKALETINGLMDDDKEFHYIDGEPKAIMSTTMEVVDGLIKDIQETKKQNDWSYKTLLEQEMDIEELLVERLEPKLLQKYGTCQGKKKYSEWYE